MWCLRQPPAPRSPRHAAATAVAAVVAATVDAPARGGWVHGACVHWQLACRRCLIAGADHSPLVTTPALLLPHSCCYYCC